MVYCAIKERCRQAILGTAWSHGLLDVALRSLPAELYWELLDAKIRAV